MNTSSPTAETTAAATSTEATGAGTFEQRFDALSQEINAENADPGSEAESVETTAEDAPAAAVEQPAAPPPEDVAAQQRAAERRERLAKMKEDNRAQVDRKAALAAQDKLARDYAAAQKRAEEAEARAARSIDVETIDEAAWLALAEKRNISPDRITQWIRDSVEKPERVAEAAAIKATQAAIDPKLAALEARVAAAEERAARAERVSAAREAQVAEQRETQAFLGMVQKSAERAPLAARLLAADPDEFLMVAEAAAVNVEGMGPQALLDAVEELLDGNGRKAAQTYAALYGLTSQPTAPVTQPTTRGAAKPNTVSNSFARERASIVEEEAFVGLTLEERVAKLKSMR